MNRNVWITCIVLLVIVLIGLNLSRDKEISDVEMPSVMKQKGRLSAKELYSQALERKKERDMLEAKELYQMILSDYPDVDNIEMVEKELETLNMYILFSNTPTPKTVIHEVQPGDTLGVLAKKYGEYTGSVSGKVVISAAVTADIIRTEVGQDFSESQRQGREFLRID